MRRPLSLVSALGSLLIALPQFALAQQAPPNRLTMALLGDAILTRRLSPYKEPQFLSMIDLIRRQDVGIVNFEILAHDYEPAPASESGGTYMRTDPFLVKELTWAGVDMVNLANNHTGDYSAEGGQITRRYVEGAGLVAAGQGDDLQKARAPVFFETAHGRVALIGTTNSGSVQSQAGASIPGVPGRPGMSMLRSGPTTPRTLQRDQLESLRATLKAMGQPVSAPGQPLSVFGQLLSPGDRTANPGPQGPDARDMAELVASVKSARALADYVVVTIHAHSQGAYLPIFARGMIDAGADVVYGHGPHFLTGVEIYKGKPILYSIGDFVFQNETLLRLPFDNYDDYGLGDSVLGGVADFNNRRYGFDPQLGKETTGFPTDRRIWEAVIAVPTFEGPRLVSLELHPIDLGFGQPAHVRGRPMFANKELGKKIIDDIVTASRSYGTQIEWQEARGVAVVRIPPTTPGPRR
jgi:poly-gamma-glutamate capsule biosynthesis protein CapA/YwtB (metallophosphatase superfamily)